VLDRLSRLPVCYQSGYNGRYLCGLGVVFRLFHREPLVQKCGIELSAHEAMAVQDALMERNGGLDSHDPEFLQRPAHSQNRLTA
jgi:hypothetical protein